MRLFNRTNQDLQNTDDPTPEEVEAEEVAAVAETQEPDASIINEAPEFEMLSSEELDELYDENGDARWAVDGVPTDQEGNPIPASRPAPLTQAADAPAEEITAALPAVSTPEKPERARPNFRSPFADGLLSAEERQQAEELIDPSALSLIETISARIADRVIAADRQQQAMVRDIGISDDYHDEVSQRMTAVQSLVPHNLRGTKQGNEVALSLAALNEANETGGNLIEIMAKWGNRAQPVHPQLAPAPQPVQPRPQKPQTPFMAPSAKTTVPRGAPEAVRSNRPAKMTGALTSDALALIQSERNVMKNGR